MRITTISPNNCQLANSRIVSGRVELFQGRVQMAHPDHIVAPEQSDTMPLLEPVYPLTAGLTPKILRRTIGQALTRLPNLPEWIPAPVMAEHNWPNFADAMRAVHTPRSEGDILPTNPARARLAFDELLANQLALTMVRQQASELRLAVVLRRRALVTALKAGLPFAMTTAQQHAINEITADQAAPKRMLRMLQGDVGSGKTLVHWWPCSPLPKPVRKRRWPRPKCWHASIMPVLAPC